VVEHGARERCRGARAEAAVLDDHGERDARVIERRKGDEQRMVAMALGDFRFLVFLALLHGDHLRGAGLAADAVGDAGEGARAGAFLVDAGHGALDELDVVAPEAHGLQDLGGHLAPLAVARMVDVLDEARLVYMAAAREHRHRLRQLQRRIRVVALADADRDGLAGEPLLVGGALEALLLPLGRGQHAGELAGEIDARARAEAEGSEEARDRVDAHVVRQVVVVGVAGLDDRLVHVDRAVTALLVVAEAPPAEIEIARVEDGRARGALTGLERAEREIGLDGRARRVKARNGAVVERLVDRAVELGPVLRIDAVDEQIRVEARLRHQGEYPAARRIDGDQRAAALAERDLGDLLQAHVERQRDVIAWQRRAARQRADAAAGGVDLDLLEAGGAMELGLVGGLDAGLADVIGAAVIRADAVFLELRLVLRVDAPEIAEHMRADVAERILAEEARLDLHALEAVAVGGELRHFLVGQPVAQRQVLRIARLLEQLLE